MRYVIAGMANLLVVALASAQTPKIPVRHGIEANFEIYPQSTPKEALTSILKAIDRDRIDYLLAHLAEPTWVDGHVSKFGQFDTFVQQVRAKLADDPETLKDLRRFHRSGVWTEDDMVSVIRLKDVPKRQVTLKRIDGRWFMSNAMQENAPPEKPEPKPAE